MLGTVVSAIVICLGAGLIGQLVLRLCGAREWTWLAPSVGISAAMICSVPAVYVPGRATTGAAVLGMIIAYVLFKAIRCPALRPPAAGLVAAVPIILLALVPFAANGHAGTLGVSFNNDMAFHLGQVDAYRSEDIAHVIEVDPSYPVGPPALVAAVAQGLGIRTEEAFAGMTMASAVLVAWTAIAALSKARWLGQLVVATLSAMSFLVSAYYGQGSFKELLQAAFVLALAVFLQRHREWKGQLRWVPAVLLIAGMLSIYSIQGLVWPVALIGVWSVGLVAHRLAGGVSFSDVLVSLQAQVASVVVGSAVLVVIMTPQIPRLARFVSATAGTNVTGIEKSNIGNLAGSLSLWQAFGVWDNPDYRFPALDPFVTGMWVAAMVGLVTAGAAWWLWQREWVVPTAAAVSLLIWVASDRTQSPYVSAKALVIVSPLLVLLAARPVVELAAGRPGRPPFLRVGAVVVAVVMVAKVDGSSWNALRYSRVGPGAHLHELRQLRPLLRGRPTLFLGNDDFIRWELAGEPVDAPVIGFQGIATRPEKPWTYGTPLDFDSVDAPTLNRYDWIIAPRDAAGSVPPDELELVKLTSSFALWRRTAPVQPRSVLAEGPAAAAVLDCSTPSGLKLQQGGGVAAVREPTVTATVPPLRRESANEVRLSLGAGTWELQAPYTSQHELEVTAPGLRAVLPANLDRPGPRWRIGRLRLATPATVSVQIRVKEPPLSSKRPTLNIEAILATPAVSPQVVSIDEACGRLVDWYRSGTP